MTRKRTSHRGGARSASQRRAGTNDSVLRALSKEEIRRLAIDAWEPSLLRNMLEAECKLPRR
nr:hypothetical protein [Gammaproteobacteria bacterium]